MEQLISSLVHSYDTGSLSRRELIQRLGLLTQVPAAAADAITIVSINHVSVQVRDVQRSADFYKRVFSLRESRSDADTVGLASGRCHVSIRRGTPTGVIDHFAFGVNRLDEDRLTAEFKRRVVETRHEPPQFGFHVIDPDGVRVQITENDAQHR